MVKSGVELLAQYLYETRTRKGLSLPEIRRRGGPSIGTLGELESGSLASIPKPATLKKIALGLGVPYEEVLRAAGIIQGESEGVTGAELQELLDLTRSLGPEDLEELVLLARLKAQRAQGRS